MSMGIHFLNANDQFSDDRVLEKIYNEKFLNWILFMLI